MMGYISEDLKKECCFNQRGDICKVLSYGIPENDGWIHMIPAYYIKEVPFKEYKELEKISKFSGKDYVTSIIDMDTTLMMIDRIERLEKGLDIAMSSLGSCVVRRKG